MPEMTFGDFCNTLADAVEHAVDMSDGAMGCFLCLVLRQVKCIPERYAVVYMQKHGWSPDHAKTVQDLIDEAESTVGGGCFSLQLEAFYRIEGDTCSNQARVAWLRAGCPKFWEE